VVIEAEPEAKPEAEPEAVAPEKVAAPSPVGVGCPSYWESFVSASPKEFWQSAYLVCRKSCNNIGGCTNAIQILRTNLVLLTAEVSVSWVL
jgi:hypothetical protein